MKTIRMLLIMITLAAFSASVVAQKPWAVPDNYKTMKNAKADAKAGAQLWTKNCASCHGKMGMGDGVKARALKSHPGDFSSADFQKQTDGEIFYKTKFGRGEMPKYEGKLTDDEIWNIVAYTRTFKK